MRSLKHVLTAIALVFGIVLTSQASDTGKTNETGKKSELKNQTHCPVMGGKIDSTVFTDIQGQRVYHCCPMCSGKLKADPDKYFKKAAEEGILFENNQTTCPVSGEKLEDKSIYTDYNGRRVVFCCKKCRGTFYEDPETYLKKLDEGADSNTENKMKMDHGDHSDHNH